MKINEITIDYEIQLKARGIDPGTQAGYVEALSNGVKLPSVIVFHDKESFWLADGFHRIGAAKFLGRSDINVKVLDGTRQDAMIYAATANAEHGKPMSQAEKKEAGLRLLELTTLSGREIARRLAVANSTVDNWVSAQNWADRKVTPTRNGTTYEMDTSNIGAAEEQESIAWSPEPEPDEKPFNKHAFLGVARPEDEGRPEGDFIPTDPRAVKALINMEPFSPEWTGVIWEPCCGNGVVSKVLIEDGYTVYSTDLYDRGYGEINLDFFSFYMSPAQTIITNPPYQFPSRTGGTGTDGVEVFIEHALSLPEIKRVALLMPPSKLHTESRRKFFETGSGFRYYCPFVNRLVMNRYGIPGENGGMMDFSWYVWDVGYQGRAEVRHLTA